jgi:dTDP-4-amino-4,6-dideoxygalactose transaminase
MESQLIPFNKPYFPKETLQYFGNVIDSGFSKGDGRYTEKSSELISELSGGGDVLMTPSCTHALEMAALLLDLKPGDEVIMPSYTFVSTANAFVARGGKPVFVDIRPDTLNINERLIEEAITSKTKAIVVVHYAGIACEMDTISSIANNHNLVLIEDAAQGLLSTYKSKPLGGIASLGCLSFHETKNITCGEGGALLIRDRSLIEKAEVIREKGTDRSRFFRGEVDKYTWQSFGSSLLPGDLTSAFLKAQLEQAHFITNERKRIFSIYHTLFSNSDISEFIDLPYIPAECEGNGHMYFLILNQELDRETFINLMKDADIGVVSHYVPLHSSPAGVKFGRYQGKLPITDSISSKLVRLPLYVGLTESQQERIYQTVRRIVLKLTK